MIDKLVEAIFALVHEMREDRKQRPLATKQDVADSEARIIKAFGTAGSVQKEAAAITADLKASAEPLKAAVEANK